MSNCLVGIRIADEEGLKGVREDDPPVLPRVRAGFQNFFLPHSHSKCPLFLRLRPNTTAGQRDRQTPRKTLVVWSLYLCEFEMNGDRSYVVIKSLFDYFSISITVGCIYSRLSCNQPIREENGSGLSSQYLIHRVFGYLIPYEKFNFFLSQNNDSKFDLKTTNCSVCGLGYNSKKCQSMCTHKV